MNDSFDERYAKLMKEQAKSSGERIQLFSRPGVEEGLQEKIDDDISKLRTYFEENNFSGMADIFHNHGYVITHDGKFKRRSNIENYFRRLKRDGATGLVFKLVQAFIFEVNTHRRTRSKRTIVHSASAVLRFTVDIPGSSPHNGGGGTGYFHQNDCEWVPAP